jgi:hypothetical protein
VLFASPAFETLDWRPVLLPGAAELDALSRWSDGAAQLAQAELPARARFAEAERTRRDYVARPVLDPRTPGSRADPSAPQVRLAETAEGPRVMLGLPRSHGDPSVVEVLFECRLLSALSSTLPVVARIDVTDSTLVSDYRALTSRGAAIVEERVALAVSALLDGCFAEAMKPERRYRFFEDARLVALLAVFLRIELSGLAREKQADLAEKLRFKIAWPTVQGGDELLYAHHAVGSALYVGRDRYTSWLGPTAGRAELDHALMHVPSGPIGVAMSEILAVLGYELRDVTDEVARLQAHRERGDLGAAPKLGGAARYPRLRASFDTLGVISAAGEFEILSQGPSELRLVDLEGFARFTIASTRIFFLAIVRVESAITDEFKASMANAIDARALLHLREVADHLEELPLFVRTYLRAALCRELAKSEELWREALALPLFEDTDGAFRSFDAFGGKSGTAVPWTNESAPYPSAALSSPALVLSAEEAHALASVGLALCDVSPQIQLARVGELRASAEPRARIELDPEQRRSCVAVAPIRMGTLTGEMGVLRPGSIATRGIEVHLGRRPLCHLDDGPGVALVAVIDDSAITPSIGFDALANPDDANRIRDAVRSAVSGALGSALRPPEDALASRYVDRRIVTTSRRDAPSASMDVAGLFWLPAVWPDRPTVRLRAPDGTTSRQLAATHAANVVFSWAISIEGDLLVEPASGEGETTACDRAAPGKLALEALIDLVNEATERDAPEALVAPYSLSLALLGHGAGPRLPIVGGGDVDVAALLDEIAACGAVWYTEKCGTAMGQFPGKAPRFVLAPSPLLRVLRARMGSTLRELGGGEERSPAAEPAIDPMPEKVDAPAQVDATALESESASENPASESVIERVRAHLGALFASDPIEEAPPSLPSLRAELLRALARLDLVDHPVAHVKYVRRGRFLRFDKKSATLFINRHDPVFARVLGGREEDRVRPLILRGPELTFLVAAAVSEVNRALYVVTDGDECRALRALIAE